MNCVKLHETDCPYRMPGDSGLCMATSCQKTLDDILAALREMLQKFNHINCATSTTFEGVKEQFDRPVEMPIKEVYSKDNPLKPKRRGPKPKTKE